ncbi:hypothetical protein DOE76_14720 [Leifsonia sp. ku-ls]|nr:hypothetical protein DOE76_14720 [Leifsonia sp. ku-ls]
MLVSVSDRPWRQLQIGLSAVVLAAAQILVMEYDTDVPQFSETLYLPVALLSLLSAGWVIIRMTGFPFALTTAIVAYILLRAALTAGLTGAGWLAPDLPLALLGLAAVDLLQSLPRLRWLVAASIVAALESLLCNRAQQRADRVDSAVDDGSGGRGSRSCLCGRRQESRCYSDDRSPARVEFCTGHTGAG